MNQQGLDRTTALDRAQARSGRDELLARTVPRRAVVGGRHLFEAPGLPELDLFEAALELGALP